MVRLSVALATTFAWTAQGMPSLYTQDFDHISAYEDPDWCWGAESTCQFLDVKTTEFAYDNVLEFTYVPTSQGSPRIWQAKSITPGLVRAAMSYDLYFPEAFEWVRGGKLGLGLRGGTGTVGCAPIDPAGFSLRTMWRPDGQLVMYMYDQHRTETCGQDIESNVFFEKGRWYHLTLFIELNVPASASNGKALLYLDGTEVARLEGIQFRGDDHDDVLVDEWTVNTFYGGSDPSWSPSTTTYMYIDNVSLTGSTAKSTCESWCLSESDLAPYCDNPMHDCAGCAACGGTATPGPSTTLGPATTTTIPAQVANENCPSYCVSNAATLYGGWLQVCGWGSCQGCEICGSETENPSCKLYCWNNLHVQNKSLETVCGWSTCNACEDCIGTTAAAATSSTSEGASTTTLTLAPSTSTKTTTTVITTTTQVATTTTATATSTSTIAATTTSTAAPTTTTIDQAQEANENCPSYCVSNAATLYGGWLQVCGWSSCQGCEICGTETQNPSCKLHCWNNFHVANDPVAEVCAWSTCNACEECSATTTVAASTTQGMLTTTTPSLITTTQTSTAVPATTSKTSTTVTTTSTQTSTTGTTTTTKTSTTATKTSTQTSTSVTTTTTRTSTTLTTTSTQTSTTVTTTATKTSTTLTTTSTQTSTTVTTTATKTSTTATTTSTQTSTTVTTTTTKTSTTVTTTSTQTSTTITTITTTSTLTSTQVGTGTTTTAFATTTVQAQEANENCPSYCVSNSATLYGGWLQVCGWSSCQGCEICGTETENPSCKLHCWNNFHVKNDPVEEVCGWSTCSSCEECSATTTAASPTTTTQVATTTTTPVPTTTTQAQEANENCPSYCVSNAATLYGGWLQVCGWGSCGSCEVCGSETEPPNCKLYCWNNIHVQNKSLAEVCAWSTCYACDDCLWV